jgi:hypothetical protein
VVDDDCSLLGVCTTSQCRCDPGWTGRGCGVADLKPWDRTVTPGYRNTTQASWGGLPVQTSDGKFHAVATQIAKGCPLSLFLNNSAVVRLEAASPGGPWVYAGQVLPPMHHNPTIVGPTSDGYYGDYYY